MVRRRVLERALEGRVADQELRVGLLAERDVLGLGEEHLRQDDGGRALRRDGDGTDALERRLRDQLDRLDGALRGDAQAREDPQPLGVARVLDRRDRREVALTGEERVVQVRRHAADLLERRVDPVEDRRHVHVGDAPEPDHAPRTSFWHTRLTSGPDPPPCSRPSVSPKSARVCDEPCRKWNIGANALPAGPTAVRPTAARPAAAPPAVTRPTA